MTGLTIGVIDYTAGSSRISFTFGNPNYFAAVQLMWFTLFAGHLLFQKSSLTWERNLYVLSLVTAISLIFLSGSRNGILCCGIFSVICFFITWRRAGWKVWHSATLVLGVALLTWWATTVGQNAVSKTAQLLEGGGSSEMGRLTVWQMVLDLWQQSPSSLLIGYGWGALYPMSMNYSSADLLFRLDSVGFRHAHSEPLELLLEGGLVALAILACLILWIVRGVYLQKGAPKFAQNQILGLSLLLLFAFSFFSVSTRYAVVLLPAAILLGLLLRSSSACWSPGPWASRVLVLSLVGLILGNAYISGRDFISDAYLKQALKSNRSTEAAELYDKAVSVSPKRISPRYEQFAFLATRADPNLLQKVNLAHAEMEELIPNFKNVAEFHAQYLGSVGDFSGAAKQLSSLAEIRSFHLLYLADAMFYFWVSQDHTSFKEASHTLLHRAFEAETRRVGGTLAAAKRLKMNAEELIRLEFASGRVIDISADTLIERIPANLRSNQPILRYYILSEVSRILYLNIDGLETPRFFELLSADDRDKVIRLAAKLDDIEMKRSNK